jgi:outer membrane protein assembly factor BamB
VKSVRDRTPILIQVPEAPRCAYNSAIFEVKRGNFGMTISEPVRNVVAVLCLIFLAFGLVSCTSSIPASGPATTANDVVTFHNDNARTGQALGETILTANTVKNNFGRIGFFSVDGKVDAQPLFLSNVSIPSQGTHSVIYVATEHASVYALDADNGQTLWQASLLGTGESTSDPRGCAEAVSPEIGITATPVIDRTRGPNGAIYVVAMSKDTSGNYFQRLHVLDVASGAELFGGPKNITASYPGAGDSSAGGSVIFDPAMYKDRAALLLLNGVVYTTWASHCDQRPYTGWIIGYDAATLNQSGVLNVTPNGNEGGIWMSGSGPAADNDGNIYLLDGNGTFDTTLDANGFPNQGDFGNGFLKLSVQGGALVVADYFEMGAQQEENGTDQDLGSGGTLVLPDQTDASGKVWHLAVGAGKDSNLYVVDRDSMGKFKPSGDAIFQELRAFFPARVFSTPAYFNGTVYYGGWSDQIKAHTLKNGQFQTSPNSETSNVFPSPGATPSISANGTNDAIVWAVENGNTASLYAYDATDLSKQLYKSDQVGPGNKFIVPTIAHGKVYVGTANGVAVYGLR